MHIVLDSGEGRFFLERKRSIFLASDRNKMYLTKLETMGLGGIESSFPPASSWLPEKSHCKTPAHVWAHAEGWRCRHAIGFRHCLDKDFSQSQDRVPFRKLPLLCCCPSLWFFFFPLQKILDWGIVLMICSVFQRGWLIWKTQQDSWNHCQKLSSVLLSQLPAFCAFAAETGPFLKMQLDIS